MTTVLHLGVVDVPYGPESTDSRATKVGKDSLKKDAAKTLGTEKRSVTTGDVGEILEARYGIMQVFYAENKDAISTWLVESIIGATESLMMGAPPSPDPFGSGTSKIENAFKEFLSSKDAERAIGTMRFSVDFSNFLGDVSAIEVPTKAALRGVNHRRAHPYAADNPRRPSFIDTGLYQNSFKAWVD